jgi:hypothetical protein
MDHEFETTRPEAGRNLIPVAVVTTCLLGLALGLTPFLVQLKHDLKTAVTSWPEVLLIVFLTGSIAALILIACAALGFFIGLALRAIVRTRVPGGGRA